MALFLSDADERNCYVRTLYNRELGREPSVAEQQQWSGALAAQGADAVLAVIRDSKEAQGFRAKRGW